MNPVYQDKEDDKWYFWDEIGSYRYGPYDSESEAYAKLDEYGDLLNSKDKK